MKKSLLALAILGAFAGAASAQSSVTIYGVVDAGISRTDNGTNSTTALTSGQQSGSRLGFKGTEDLGGGLSAQFVLENGFSADTGNLGQGGRLFGRQAWVGLAGGFGAVRLGRQQTEMYEAYGAIDPFAIGLAGNMQRIFFNGAQAASFFDRTDNAISYYSPNFSGFTGKLSYSFGETAGDSSANDQVGAGLAYANGPLNVQFAYRNINSLNAAGTSDFDRRTAFLGATYDFGVVKAHLGYADSKLKTDVPAGVADVKYRDWLVGLSMKLGTGTLMASYIRDDLRTVDEGVSTQAAIGYSHPLSKRTNLYTSYAHVSNDDARTLTVNAAGESGSLFNVGIRHTF